MDMLRLLVVALLLTTVQIILGRYFDPLNDLSRPCKDGFGQTRYLSTWDAGTGMPISAPRVIFSISAG